MMNPARQRMSDELLTKQLTDYLAERIAAGGADANPDVQPAVGIFAPANGV